LVFAIRRAQANQEGLKLNFTLRGLVDADGVHKFVKAYIL
jgi:hypothetical protein